MAAANIPSCDVNFFSNVNFPRNSVEIEFVDEDDLPIANVYEHQASDNEVDSDFAESESESCSDDEEEEEDHAGQPRNACGWERNITARPDLPFHQQAGPTIDMNERMTVPDFFQIYFTVQVWNLLVEQTNLYAQQKRIQSESSVWYPVTVEELKAWVALTLLMGIVKKPALRMYWITDATLNTPYFSHVMARDRYFQILRYLHFANNNEEIKDKNQPGYDKLFKVRKLLNLLLPKFP